MYGSVSQQQENPTTNKDGAGNIETAERKENSGKEVTQVVKEMFSADDQFRKAMALTYMLNLDPANSPADKHFLLYTQVDGQIPPKRAVHLYHTPLYVCAQKVLKAFTGD